MRWTKHVTLCISLLAATAFGGLAQAGQKGNLKVVFTGLTQNVGTVRIALVHTKAGYEDEHKYGFRLDEVKVKDLKAEHTFSEIPAGIYSVKAYHDLNGDKKLNKNLFGQPLEPYGFSNNVRGIFGPPSYEKTTFRFDADAAEISIKLSK